MALNLSTVSPVARTASKSFIGRIDAIEFIIQPFFFLFYRRKPCGTIEYRQRDQSDTFVQTNSTGFQSRRNL